MSEHDELLSEIRLDGWVQDHRPEWCYRIDHLPSRQMTTYSRADGEHIGEGWAFVLDVEACEYEAEYTDAPIEFVEQRWVLESERTFTLPVCRQCDQPATHWGLCETHAREDDPEYFSSKEQP